MVAVDSDFRDRMESPLEETDYETELGPEWPETHSASSG